MFYLYSWHLYAGDKAFALRLAQYGILRDKYFFGKTSLYKLNCMANKITPEVPGSLSGHSEFQEVSVYIKTVPANTGSSIFILLLICLCRFPLMDFWICICRSWNIYISLRFFVTVCVTAVVLYLSVSYFLCIIYELPSWKVFIPCCVNNCIFPT